MSFLRAWRDAARVLAEAAASVCLACTRGGGKCTCTRACPDNPSCEGKS